MTSDDTRIAILETNYISMDKKLDGVDGKVDKLNEKFDTLIEKLEGKFVMRTEFKVAIGVLSVLGALASFIVYLKK